MAAPLAQQGAATTVLKFARIRAEPDAPSPTNLLKLALEGSLDSCSLAGSANSQGFLFRFAENPTHPSQSATGASTSTRSMHNSHEEDTP